MMFVEVRYSHEVNSNSPYKKITGRLSHFSQSDIFNRWLLWTFYGVNSYTIQNQANISTVHTISHTRRYLPINITIAPA